MTFRSWGFAALFGLVLGLPAAAGASIDLVSRVAGEPSVAGGGNGRMSRPSLSADGRFVAFESEASNLTAGDTNGGVSDIFVYDRDTDTTELLTPGGNRDSTRASISADGRFVTFQSEATNLVAGDTGGGTIDVFLHDRDTDTTQLITAGGNDLSQVPSISANGRFVAFESRADNLAPVDRVGIFHVFVYDRETNSIQPLAQSGPGANFSSGPSISADGRFIAFNSDASNLVASDPNGEEVDVFVYDRDTDTIELITAGGNKPSLRPSISADGRLVAFESRAGNLVAGDTNDDSSDIFVYDRDTNTTQLLTAGSSRVTGITPSSGSAEISGNGRWVVFASSADNLVAGDTNSRTDTFIYDRDSDSIELLAPGGTYSISADGQLVAFTIGRNNFVPGLITNGYVEVLVLDRATSTFENVHSADLTFEIFSGNNSSGDPSVSANGRFVAYRSRATDLVSGDTGTDGIFHIFVYDQETGLNKRLTTGANADSDNVAISADGRIVVFESDANNIGGSTNNDRTNIFAYDRATDTIERITAGGNNKSHLPSVSADGRFVVFQSFASNLVAGDSNGSDPDIFVYDRQSGVTEILTTGGNSVFSLFRTLDASPSISADGRFVAFQSTASNLAAGDTNGDDFDVFVYDRDSDSLELVTAGANRRSTHPSISADGRWLLFLSTADNLVPGDTIVGNDFRSFDKIFLYDRETGTFEIPPIRGDNRRISTLRASLSADGRFIAFASDATDFGIEDVDTLRDIFVFDRETSAITSLTQGADNHSDSPSISADGRTVAFSSNANNLARESSANPVSASNVFVSVANEPPTADSLATTTNEDTSVGVSVTGFDPDADNLTFEIVTPPANGEVSGTAPNFVYTPNADFFGTDVFTFSANDGLELSEPATVTVAVVGVNDAPVTAGAAGGITEFTTAEDVPVAIALEGSDIDGDPLTYLLTALPANGTLSGTAPNFSYIPGADFIGSDQFSFAVSDGVLTSAAVTISLTVTSTNDVPVAVPQALTTPSNTPLAIRLTGTDPDNASLSFSIVNLPANGNLLGELPDLVYTPANGFAGVDSFTFAVSDGVSTSFPASVSLTVTAVDSPPSENSPPVAAAQSVTTPQETPVSIVLTGTDADGDALSFDFVALPANGSLSGTPPNVIYTPDVNYLGADSFSFAVSDAEDTSAAATVSITVAAGAIELFSAVLPTSRSVEVGTTATAFATLINAGSVTAQGCAVQLPDDLGATFFYQASDPSTNAVVGQRNAPVDIPPGAAQSFVFGITPTEELSAVDVALEFQCANATDASSFVGLNTLLLSASFTPVPDLIALVATTTDNGVMELSNNSGFFTAATINVGSAATITVSADTGEATLPLTLVLCQTDPLTSACINPAVPGTEPVIVDVVAGGSPTFAVFVTAAEPIALDPASNRVFLRFSDELGEVRGATSVAIENRQ